MKSLRLLLLAPVSLLLTCASAQVVIGTAEGGLGADNSAASGVPLFATGTVTLTSTNGTGNLLRSAGTAAITSGKTLTVPNTLTLAGTDGTTITFPATSATMARTDGANTFTAGQTISANNAGLTLHTGATVTSSSGRLDLAGGGTGAATIWVGEAKHEVAVKANTDGLLSATTNVLSIQNLDTQRPSAIRYLDPSGNEVLAHGFTPDNVSVSAYWRGKTFTENSWPSFNTPAAQKAYPYIFVNTGYYSSAAHSFYVWGVGQDGEYSVYQKSFESATPTQAIYHDGAGKVAIIGTTTGSYPFRVNGTGADLVNSSGSVDLALSRSANSAGATTQYKTGATLEWYHGTRGLTNSNWYLFNNNTSSNALTVDYASNLLTLAGGLTMAGDFLVSSTGSANVSLNRASTSFGSTFNFNTAGSNKWFMGTRGLSTEDFYLFNQTAGNSAIVVTASNSLVTLAGGLTVAGTVIHTLSATPSSASAAGTVGTLSWDTNFIYICTATNTWKRVAIATW